MSLITSSITTTSNLLTMETLKTKTLFNHGVALMFSTFYDNPKIKWSTEIRSPSGFNIKTPGNWMII